MAVTTDIRMYNQKNLGDCFLLHFSSGDEESYLLIDFGSYEGSNAEREKEIAHNIMETIGDKKLTIVLTHQHKDHYSGFLTAGEILKGNVEIKAEREVWLSFLDNENSKEGDLIRSVTEKYWKKNAKAKELMVGKYGGVPAVDAMLAAKEGYDLFAEGQSGGAAISKLMEIANRPVRFLTPGDSFLLPGTAEGVRVYVLGPPYDKDFLTKMNPSKTEEVVGFNAMELANMDLSGTLMLEALKGIAGDADCKDIDFPFNRQFIDEGEQNPLRDIYNLPDNAWRTIDHEWLSELGRLSLHMDRLTNNTSMVLAFELVASGKVLLFVGDAQIGNWQSWFNVKFKDSEVTGEDLLKRTVVYKSGHHSSHNATLRKGLDLMDESELVILIPVNERVSTKFGFAMLKPEMLYGYHRKAKGRVFRSDSVEQEGSKFNLDYPFAKRDDPGLQLMVFTPEAEGHLKADEHLWIGLMINES